jgi:hypothetical protein
VHIKRIFASIQYLKLYSPLQILNSRYSKSNNILGFVQSGIWGVGIQSFNLVTGETKSNFGLLCVLAEQIHEMAQLLCTQNTIHFSKIILQDKLMFTFPLQLVLLQQYETILVINIFEVKVLKEKSLTS